MGEIVTRNV